MDYQDALARLRDKYGAVELTNPLTDAEAAVAAAFTDTVAALCADQIKRQIWLSRHFQALIRCLLAEVGDDVQAAEAEMRQALADVAIEVTNAATGLAMTAIQATVHGRLLQEVRDA